MMMPFRAPCCFLILALLGSASVHGFQITTPPSADQWTCRSMQQQPLATSATRLSMAGGGPPTGSGRPVRRINNNNNNLQADNKPTMNEEIQAPQLRVVVPVPGGKDQALGILSRQEALQKAADLGGLDLILINDKSDPPVCKIVDYSKYRYRQEKKAKEVKKHSKATELKEVKMSYKIDVHDYQVRQKNASKFIQQGNRVKATVMFRGREMQHDRLGFDLLDKLADDLQDICVREGRPKREGRNLSLILGPRAEVLKKVNEGRKTQEKEKKKKKLQALAERKATKGTTLAGESETLSTAMDLPALDDDEDDEDMELDDDSIDELLGSEELIDDLFSKK